MVSEIGFLVVWSAQGKRVGVFFGGGGVACGALVRVDKHSPWNVHLLPFLSSPTPAALGYGVGGVIGHHWGWRAAFLVCGVPGVLVAFLCLWIKDPGRGNCDSPDDHVCHVCLFLLLLLFIYLV